VCGSGRAVAAEMTAQGISRSAGIVPGVDPGAHAFLHVVGHRMEDRLDRDNPGRDDIPRQQVAVGEGVGEIHGSEGERLEHDGVASKVRR
jgi:hypothetical protein